MEVAGQAELLRAGADVGHRRVGGFLHDLAEASGDQELALAGGHRDLRLEQVAADLGVGETGRDADPVLGLGLAEAVALDAQVLADELRIDAHRLEGLTGRDLLARDLAGDRGQLALERAHAGLPREVPDDLEDRGLAEDEIAVLQTVVAAHLVDEMLGRDLELLRLDVAGDLDDLHAILERPRDLAENVRRADEHHAREVVVDVEIVVREGVVLLGIEDLEHRRARIAAEIHRHLVDLVEQEDRVRAARLLQALDDLAREGADVGSAVAPDLGLVAHAAEADAHEVAPGRAGDRLAERGLADAGRPDETEDRTLQLLDEGLHREVLEDAFLRLLEPVVVRVEDLLRDLEVLHFLLVLVPGQAEHPVDVVPDHRRFCRHRRHLLQLLDLLLGPVARLLRHLLRGELLLELRELVLRIVALAELLLDRPHLLVEVVLLLGALHLLLDAAADLALDLEDLDLRLHPAEDLLEALGRRDDLEQLLAIGELEVEMGDDGVGELAGIADRGDRVDDLRGDLFVQLRVGVEGRLDGADEGLRLGRVVRLVAQLVDLDGEIRLDGGEATDLGPRAALDEDLDRAIGKPQELDDRAERPDRVDVLGRRILFAGDALRGDDEAPVGGHRVFEGLDRLGPADEERHDHVRKDHDVAERKQRNPSALSPFRRSPPIRSSRISHSPLRTAQAASA